MSFVTKRGAKICRKIEKNNLFAIFLVKNAMISRFWGIF